MPQGKDAATGEQAFCATFFVFCLCGENDRQHFISAIPHKVLEPPGASSSEPRGGFLGEKSTAHPGCPGQLQRESLSANCTEVS